MAALLFTTESRSYRLYESSRPLPDVEKVLATGPSLCLTVVGDDAQSIYSFRAATVRNILDFPGQFSPPAAIITLDRNYRSTQPILAAANGVIDLADERFTKNLWTDRTAAERPQLVSVRDETDQACYIVERVLENREGRNHAETTGGPVSRLAP